MPARGASDKVQVRDQPCAKSSPTKGGVDEFGNTARRELEERSWRWGEKHLSHVDRVKLTTKRICNRNVLEQVMWDLASLKPGGRLSGKYAGQLMERYELGFGHTSVLQFVVLNKNEKVNMDLSTALEVACNKDNKLRQTEPLSVYLEQCKGLNQRDFCYLCSCCCC